jgi:hypothetical protein
LLEFEICFCYWMEWPLFVTISLPIYVTFFCAFYARNADPQDGASKQDIFLGCCHVSALNANTFLLCLSGANFGMNLLVFFVFVFLFLSRFVLLFVVSF